MRASFLTISLLFVLNFSFGQKIMPNQKSLDQLKSIANVNIQMCVKDVFKNKIKQPLLQLPIDNNLSIDVFQQTMTLQNQDDFLFVAKRRNMDFSNRFVSQGLFYGVQGITNIYTIGLIFRF
jgi:hypothetical protein